MFIDIAIGVVVIIALITGYARGVIQPLLAEIFFLGTLLIALRYHDQLTKLTVQYLHVNAVFSVAIALILAVIMGAIGGAIGGAFHRMEAIRGIDGLLGVVVHVIVAGVICYLAIAALVTLDNGFGPTLNSAKLTLAQVNQLEQTILSNSLTASLVDKRELDSLKKAAGTKSGANMESVSQLHQLQQVYKDFLQPQLHQSRLAPILLKLGHRIPVIGKIGPSDLKAVPTPTPSPVATPKPSPTK